MKVKNLLLASLAIVAMTACSNEDEFANENNRNSTGEQAKMRLLFSFNETNGTRSVTQGESSAGTDLEYGVTKITAVLDYGDGAPRVIMKDLDITKEEGQTKIATTEEFAVTAGTNVKLYAFVNPTNLEITQTTNLDQLSVGNHSEFTGATLAYLDKDVAKNGAFLMSGETVIEKIEAKEEVNTATIEVSRVAAKLDEKTENTKLFPIMNSGLTFTGDIQEIGVKLLSHSYSNLTTDSYVLSQVSTFNSFLQPYIAKGAAANNGSYRWNETGVTYCLDNSSSANPTRVHYRAQVYFGDEPAKETFYIRAVYTEGDKTELRVYKNWKALKDAYPNVTWNDSKKDDNEYLANHSIKKYDGGICYYEAPIETAGSGQTIVRNNWYQLTVSKVSKLGTPTPALEPDETPAKLIIEAKIQPWTVQINDIEL